MRVQCGSKCGAFLEMDTAPRVGGDVRLGVQTLSELVAAFVVPPVGPTVAYQDADGLAHGNLRERQRTVEADVRVNSSIHRRCEEDLSVRKLRAGLLFSQG